MSKLTPLATLALLGLASVVLYELAPGTVYPALPRIGCSLSILALARRGARDPQPYARRMRLALVLACCGDTVLALSPTWKPGFLAAMGLFIAGHIGLIAAFGRLPPLGARAAFTLLGLGAYAAVVVAILNPSLGSMRGPVFVYVAVLVAMAWRANVAAQDRGLRFVHRAALAVGGNAFVLADTVLAFNKFHGAIPHDKLLALPPYWASLACFALSIGFAPATASHARA